MSTEYEEILTLLRAIQRDLDKINSRIEKVTTLRAQLESDREELLARMNTLNARKASIFGQ